MRTPLCSASFIVVANVVRCEGDGICKVEDFDLANRAVQVKQVNFDAQCRKSGAGGTCHSSTWHEVLSSVSSVRPRKTSTLDPVARDPMTAPRARNPSAHVLRLLTFQEWIRDTYGTGAGVDRAACVSLWQQSREAGFCKPVYGFPILREHVGRICGLSTEHAADSVERWWLHDSVREFMCVARFVMT